MRRLAVFALFLFAACGFSADEKKDPNAGVVADPATCEVWTTESGTKYHTKDCASAKVKTTLAAAVVDGDTPCAKCTPPVYDPAKVAVFSGGEGGKKYHLFSCRFAKTQTTLDKASAEGLTPCGVCKPPVLWTPPKKPDSTTGSATAAPAK